MRLLVIGAGGHAKVVIDAALLMGHEIAGVVGSPDGVASLMGLPVVADAKDIRHDEFIIAVGDNRQRAALFAEQFEAGGMGARLIHPSAIIGAGVALGEGTFIAAGVVINTGAMIGDDVVLNTACCVDHDCVIGSHAHVGPQVALCGAVELGEGVLMGVGSCATPGVAIGAWTTVGAGAAVTGDLPGDSVCVGVPARVLGPTGGDAL